MAHREDVKPPFLTRFFRAFADDLRIPDTVLAAVLTELHVTCSEKENSLEKFFKIDKQQRT